MQVAFKTPSEIIGYCIWMDREANPAFFRRQATVGSFQETNWKDWMPQDPAVMDRSALSSFQSPPWDSESPKPTLR